MNAINLRTPSRSSSHGRSSHKGTVKEALHSAHIDLCMDDSSELEETDLVKRLQAATGAHKPNGYEFDPGVITSAAGFST